jgi:hemin uptake protein HemP
MQIQNHSLPPQAAQPAAHAEPAPAKVVSSEQLLGPDGRVCIEHQGQRYTLQRTKVGKLILTK